MSSVAFLHRNFVTHYTSLPLDYKVRKYSWSVIGGPKQATIEAFGPDTDLWRLAEMVRSPVIIYSDEADPVWWGYVAEVRLTVKSESAIRNPLINQRVTAGVSVDAFYNRIAVAYTKLVAGDDSIGERDTTAWVDDDDSQAEYGIRELLWTKDNATQTHAEAARDMKLEQVKLPIPVISQYTGLRESSAKIICRGLWDTLGWQYYANAGTTEVATSTQAETILGAEGQFFSGIDLEIASGINTNEYRDGDATALFEVNQLLEMGTDNNLRMLAAVTLARRVEITEENGISINPHLIGADGSWYDGQGHEIRRSTCPVGIWARMKDVMPPSVDSSALANPALLFIDENEFNVETGRLDHRARGAPDPWGFPTIRDG